MNDKTDLESVLQNAIDELFALQTQAKDDHQKFLVESTTLIKASYKQITDSVQAAARAEKAARESVEAAKQASHIANDNREGLKFWQRAVFWFALGNLIMGAALGWFYFNLGKQITIRDYQLASLQVQYEALQAMLKQKNKAGQNRRNHIENSSDDPSENL